MAAGRYSFAIEQGATTKFEIQYTDGESNPIDLTGFTARMHIRETYDSASIILAMSSTLESDGTGLNLNGLASNQPLSEGKIGVYISAEKTAAFSFDQAVYDLELVNGSEVIRLIQGTIKLSREVTR